MQTLAPNPLYARSDSVTSVRCRTPRHATQCTCDSLRQRSKSSARSGFATRIVQAACKYIFHAARAQTGARDALEVFARQEYSYGRGPQTGGTLKPAIAHRRFAGVDGGMHKRDANGAANTTRACPRECVMLRRHGKRNSRRRRT